MYNNLISWFKIQNLLSCSPGIFRISLALIVVIHHTLGFFAFGAAAVYLFFALSGYWITRLWHEKYSLIKFRVIIFYFSRWLRLAPVLVSVMFISFLVVCYNPNSFTSSAYLSLTDLKWCLTTLSIVGITTQNMVISPAWSLAVEMQFYLIFPIIIFIVYRPWGLTVLFFLTLLYGVLKFLKGASAINGNSLMFLPYFLTGICYYIWPMAIFRKKLTYLGVYLFMTILIIIIPYTRFILNNYPGKSDSMVVIQNLWFYISTFLLVPFVMTSVKRKSSSFDRFLGNLAYPLYLFHAIPVYVYYYYREEFNVPKPLQLLLCWFMCGAGAIIIYFVIDRPFEILRRKVIIKSFQNK
jgi:peptidoglycan/LPS O-acetylase OafA/YrhL